MTEHSIFIKAPRDRKGRIALTVLWINGVELRVSPYTPLTFISKGTPA